MTRQVLRVSAWERCLLNAGAALGLLCLVLAGLALVLGLKPLIAISGSMSPGIPVGSLALAVPTPAAEVAPGQVVSVVASNGTRITHRVVSADPVTGLVLKGDANPVADLQPYSFGPADRVVFSVPFLGYVASWLSSPWVFGVGGLLCAYLLYVAFFRSDAGRSRNLPAEGSASDSVPVAGAGGPGTRRSKWLGAGAIVAALAVVIPLGVVNRVEATQAAWTASAVASAGLSAATVVPVGNVHCGNPPTDIATLRFTWAPSAPLPTGYKIEAIETNSSGVVKAGGMYKEMSIGATESSFETTIGQGTTGLLGTLLGALLGMTSYFTIKITTQYGSEWEGAPVSFTKIKATTPIVLGLIGEYRLTCSPNPG
ncbi:signal peptidase I [Arthrobacter glacialis]|uniref:signal peptidase I n=1 Tax=Arthrobacter glacialis TaxID=1664 RepID=UPI000CD46980|nr:signal peptidase I [Arthrobacter glacialis]POH60647.1 signal peptidase I [Arthrobacter glacialis]